MLNLPPQSGMSPTRRPSLRWLQVDSEGMGASLPPGMHSHHCTPARGNRRPFRFRKRNGRRFPDLPTLKKRALLLFVSPIASAGAEGYDWLG
jgi:hypothetical protein